MVIILVWEWFALKCFKEDEVVFRGVASPLNSSTGQHCVKFDWLENWTEISQLKVSDQNHYQALEHHVCAQIRLLPVTTITVFSKSR